MEKNPKMEEVYWSLPGGVRVRRTIAVTFLVAVMYSSSFFAQITVLPYIATELGIDSLDFGWLQTTFGLLQLSGGPLFGILVDAAGARAAMVLALACSAATYIGTAAAGGFWTLVLARTPGLLMHGIQGAQTVLAGVTTEEERAVVFSRMGVVFGLGFILGPGSAGLLSRSLGPRAPLFGAAAVTMSATLLVWRYIPVRTAAAAKSEDSGVSLKSYLRILSYSGVKRVLAVKNAAIVPFMALTSVLSLYLVEEMGVTAGDQSLMSTYVGLWVALLNAFGLAALRKRLSERSVLLLGLSSFCLSYFLLASVFSAFWHLYLINPALILGMSLVGSVCDARLTAAVPGTEHGTVMGLSHAINASIRTASPVVAGWALKKCGLSMFGIVGVMGSGAALFLCLPLMRDSGDVKDHKD